MRRSTLTLKFLSLAAAILSASPSFLEAAVQLPNVLSSNMVIQRDQPIRIWGWANPGEEVTVQLGDHSAKIKAGVDRRWAVTLPAHPAGDPASIEVSASNKITLENILFGDVWVCSGQSNMQWPVTASNNPQEEIKNGDHPNIRLYYVPRRPSFRPLDDIDAKWQVCSPETVGGFSAVAYFFGRKLQQELDIPIGLINTSWGGTRIEPWTPPVGFDQVPAVKNIAAEVRQRNEARPDKINQQIPGVLFNGMVDAIVPLKVKGAIWYQGESNRGEAMMYHEKMKALIAGWRSVWKDKDLPFIFVQLAPFRYRGDEYQLPEIWEAQLETIRKVPNTGMAVTTDIGNVKDIHPRNKQEVGRRLALWALANTYGQDVVHSGPIFKSLKADGGALRLTFDHAGGGLKANDEKPLTYFEVAGEDGKYREATAKIEGNEVVVSADGVTKPVSVRFAWHQEAEPNFVNKEGLPASPFRAEK